MYIMLNWCAHVLFWLNALSRVKKEKCINKHSNWNWKGVFLLHRQHHFCQYKEKSSVTKPWNKLLCSFLLYMPELWKQCQAMCCSKKKKLLNFIKFKGNKPFQTFRFSNFFLSNLSGVHYVMVCKKCTRTRTIRVE